MLKKVIDVVVGAAGGGDNIGGAQGFLRPIDVERLAKEFKLDETPIPPLPVDQTDLNDVEQTIVQRVLAEWAWHGEELVKLLRAYSSRLMSYSINAEFQRLILRADDTLAKLRSAHHTAEGELGPLRDVYVDTRAEYRAFRRDHKLHRPARTQSNRAMLLALLLLLVSVESIVNGFFFAKGSEFGLVGGIGTAIGISSFNIGLMFLVGFQPARWIHHRSYFLKFAGLKLLIAGLAAIVSLHGFAAHYRDATALVGEGAAMQHAMQRLIAHPLQLADLNSYYLFGLGLLFGLGAFWKGYVFDDPYPGYGGQWRRFEEARQNYADEHADLFDELAAIKEDTVKSLDLGIKAIPQYPQQAANIRVQRTSLLQSFRLYQTGIEAAANQLLARYRRNNGQRRWTLPYSMLDDDKVRELCADVELPEISVPKVLSDLSAAANAVRVEYELLLKKYPHTTEIADD